MRWVAPPPWLKWVLSVVVFSALLIALVLLVRSSSGGGAPGFAEDPAAAARANREGQIVTAQDQAPHRASLPSSLSARAGLERVILLDLRMRVAQRDLAGPVQRIACTPVGPQRGERVRFRCHAQVGNFTYPFAGIADLRTHELTWCKDDGVAVDPSIRVPVSHACTR